MPDGVMLALEMGCGKSKIAVDLIVNHDLRKVLIICPLSVVGVWPREFRTHAGVDYNVIPLNEGSVEKRTKIAQACVELARRKNEPIALVINYESAASGAFAKWSLAQDWDLVLLDESHRIKAPGGKRSMHFAHLGKRAKRRLCLTGTPLPHSPMDIYAQFRFLDASVFGTSFVQFRNRYANMGGYGGHQVISYKNIPELHRKMYSRSFRVTKDVLDLPPYHHTDRTFSLGSEASRFYKTLEDKMYAELDDGEITVSNALVRLLRLQQVTSGYIMDDAGNTRHVDSAKIDMLADVLEDIDPSEPVVIFARFKEDLERIKKLVEKREKKDGKMCRYGEVSGDRKDLDEGRFPENVDVLGVQIQSGGVGIDLTRAHFAIYYSLGFSLGDFEQSLSRVHRPGQTEPTTFIHLLARGTVDEKVYKALRKRKQVVEYVLSEGRYEEEEVA
jgi:SNF2 family DNA or RNA helicase